MVSAIRGSIQAASLPGHSSSRPDRTAEAAAAVFDNYSASQTTAVWDRISNWWNGTHPHEEELREISTKKYSECKERLLEIFCDITKHRSESKYRKTLLHFRSILNSMPASDADQFLHDIVRQKFTSDQKQLIGCCLEMLSYDRLIEILKEKHREAQQICDHIKFLSENFPQRKISENNEHSLAALRFASNFLRSFLNTFSRAHDFSTEDHPAIDRWDAQFRLSTFYQVIAMPMTAISTLLALLHPAISQLTTAWWASYAVVGGVLFAGIAGLTMYQKVFNHAPKYLSNDYPNLTLEAAKGDLFPVVGRSKEILEITACLGKLNNHNLNPLLIGLSGCGKTEIVRALAQEIEAGKHPNLKGVQIFHTNASMLKEMGNFGAGGYRSRMEVILDDIKGKEDRVILFLDEVHSLVGGKDQLAQKFKTEIERNPKIHVIAATTEEEYLNTIAKDTALNRRFCPIQVTPLQEKDTLIVLTNLMNHAYPDTTVNENAFRKALMLTDKTDPGVAQPSKAKALLIEAVQSVQQYKSDDSTKLNEKREELERTRLTLRREGKVNLLSIHETMRHMEKLQRELAQLEKSVAEKNGLIKRLHSLKQQKRKWQSRHIRLAHQLAKHEDEILLKKFLFEDFYPIQDLPKLIEGMEEQLEKEGVECRVTEDVVQRIFDRREPISASRKALTHSDP